MRTDRVGVGSFFEDEPRISPWTRHQDRVCAFEGCGTLLSIYNTSTFCWIHETSRVFALPGPQGRSKRRTGDPRAPHPFG